MENLLTRPEPTAVSATSVLLIDDDPFMLELLANMLRSMGVTRITLAPDGDRGAASFANGTPDLVICDLNMPGRDGFQVMEVLAAAGYKGAVILLSGMDERTLRSASLMGRFHHLRVLGAVSKPISRSNLASLIARVTP